MAVASVAPAVPPPSERDVPLLRMVREQPTDYWNDSCAVFGATVRTLRSFIRSYHHLAEAIRDIVLPDPDARPAAGAPR